MNHSFPLAIFPLRKSVRVPTDWLTLNLYEERYLAMCEYILRDVRQNNNTVPSIFGALFAAPKAQIVVQDIVVPLVEVGDVGVVCVVPHWLEGDIPTRDGTFMRRRIRLEAMAVGRFRIDHVIHRGTVQDQHAFILVNASWVFDDDDDGPHTIHSELSSPTNDDIPIALSYLKSLLKTQGIAYNSSLLEHEMKSLVTCTAKFRSKDGTSSDSVALQKILESASSKDRETIT